MPSIHTVRTTRNNAMPVVVRMMWCAFQISRATCAPALCPAQKRNFLYFIFYFVLNRFQIRIACSQLGTNDLVFRIHFWIYISLCSCVRSMYSELFRSDSHVHRWKPAEVVLLLLCGRRQWRQRCHRAPLLVQSEYDKTNSFTISRCPHAFTYSPLTQPTANIRQIGNTYIHFLGPNFRLCTNRTYGIEHLSGMDFTLRAEASAFILHFNGN